MDNYPTKLNQLAKDEYTGAPLTCSGCAHSAGSAPFPGRPSGERPCCFCTRNVQREQWLEDMKTHNPGLLEKYGVSWTAFYDNSPMRKVPMDCYISTDRVMNDVPAGSAVIA